MNRTFTLILTMIWMLTACSAAAPNVKPTVTPLSAPNGEPKVTPPSAPEADKATVTGRVIDIETGEPLADVVIRLADVIEGKEEGEEGFFILNVSSSPGARSDAQGDFIFENIPAGKYVIAVGEGDNFNNYDVIEEAGGGKAKAWEAVAGQVTDWGELKAEVLFR